MTNSLLDDDWVPESCTLPTVEVPLRRAEFDELFARDVLAVHHETPLRVRLDLRPGAVVAARAAELAVKETGCCSFFAFDLAVAGGAMSLGIETTADHEQILAALGSRARAKLGAAS